MRTRVLYFFILLTNNILAFFFLSLIFIGAFSMSPEAVHPLNEKEVLIRQLIYGVSISIIFSFISLLISSVFKKKLSLNKRICKNIFYIQLVTLLIIYTTMYVILILI